MSHVMYIEMKGRYNFIIYYVFGFYIHGKNYVPKHQPKLVYHQENPLREKMRVILITLFFFIRVIVADEAGIAINPAEEAGISETTNK